MPSVHSDLQRFTSEKKSAIQPIITPDTEATLVRGEASSDSREKTEAFRG